MILHGKLKFITLFLINNSSMTGNEIRSSIKKITGYWKPSPGSMYPLLNKLYLDGFLKVERMSNKKIYSITKKGRDLILSFDESREKVKEEILGIIDLIKNIDELGDVDEFKSKIFEMKCNLELVNLGTLEEMILDKSKNEENLPEIKKILYEAIRRVEKLK